MLITSTQNTKLKNVRALFKDKKLRESHGVFLCEGLNLVKDIPDRFSVSDVFLAESKESLASTFHEKFGVEPYIVKDELFNTITDTVTPSGILTVVKKPKKPLSVSGDTVLLLDGISDAGNVGTIIRSAAAREIQTVILSECADAYAPKTVRAAMSGTFFTDIIECDKNTALSLVNGYDIVALDMGGENIYQYARTGKIALAVGNEAHGLSEEVRSAAKTILAIPMKGKVESLNAAISISIAMFLIS